MVALAKTSPLLSKAKTVFSKVGAAGLLIILSMLANCSFKP